MQASRINEQYEDSNVHIPNIVQLLLNRGLLEKSQLSEFAAAFDAQK